MSVVFAVAESMTLVGAVPAEQAASAGQMLLWVAVPYAALAIMLAGFCYRVVKWAWSPVPFRIPTTCGQQKSLPWIRAASVDNPSTARGALVRMGLEILLFRSLFRNSRAELHDKRYLFGESKLLWLGALAFHWSLLWILVRHLRFFIQPVPAFVSVIASLDGFFQVGTPELYITDVFVVCAGLYLLLRRWSDPLVRYVSQLADYFALLLLLCIAGSGILMRYYARVDLVAVKRLALGLATFHPIVPAGLSVVFLIHLVLVCILAVYLPFGKLMHMGGAFLSPTRNLANNSRIKRHINPWNYPVKTHTYAEWEEEFRDKIKAAGIPLNEAQSDGTTHTN